MNCANHPERTATAFCQNCGKPLCPECIRGADGLVLCEPCLLVRGTTTGASGFAASSTPGASTPGVSFPGVSTSGSAWSTPPSATPGAAGAWQPVTQAGARPGYVPVTGTSQTSPGLAALLGFIPGVGAMYNGQFVKALLHVIIFIVLIGTTEHLPLVGILIAAWVFYQVFDAAQTAAARRDGRPLPDPFGILDMSQRLGPQHPTYPAAPPNAQAPFQAPFQTPNPPYSQAPGQPQPYGPGYAPTQAAPYPPPQRRGEPVGAIVLIAVGLLLLLSTLGVLDLDWIWRGWPVLVLLLGVWLLFRRATAPPAFGPVSSGPGSSGTVSSEPGSSGPSAPFGAGPAGSAISEPSPIPRGNPLSITPQPTTPSEEETR